MESLLFISILSVFALIGVYSVTRGIIASHFVPEPKNVILRVKNCENDIEYTLRALLARYPKSRIIVRIEPSDDNTAEIVRRMERSCERITAE